jgi:putative membrane protein
MTIMRFLKGALAGAIGGIAGTLAMNYAQRLWTLQVDRTPPRSAGAPHDARDWQERTENRNSNEIAAQALARTTIDRRLSDRELSVVAPLIHFSFGAVVGAAYGAYVDTAPRQRPSGAALGSAVWVAADEIAMPLFGLSHSTLERPLEMHVQSLVAHLVYGIVAERVRRVTRPLLGPPYHPNGRGRGQADNES